MNFKRIENGKAWLGGICSGLAYVFSIPVWIVRVVFLILCFPVKVFPIVYLIVWLMAPKYNELPKDYDKLCEN